jgi:hypothetical protein
MTAPQIDPAAALLFVINSAAGTLDLDAKRAVIETALAAQGRTGELLTCRPAELLHVARFGHSRSHFLSTTTGCSCSSWVPSRKTRWLASLVTAACPR